MKRYIPLNASESAVLVDANTLLPRDSVYEPLTKMIIEAVNKVKNADGKPLNMLREHNAISIDGARGTGKTAVLVNLKSYLKDQDVLKDVHLFDPIDPTLLEEGESLFLHIIVAAVLHDKDVKEAQRKEPNKARNLNQTLEKLAQSLESIETQKNCHGMDKIRAMYSNKHLADCVQDFFREVLSLLGKKLLILPIDDVDTSLNRAFENLEIVRRYLATPYVLPIVSGDSVLYNEVTWRDFHGRLTKDSKHLSETAYETAVELAAEYQRKILPFPRRLTMPEVSQYWQGKDIYLRDGQQNEVMPLRNFIAWLEIFLSGPVNSLGDSQLTRPIPSMRALTQLLNQCHQLIPALPETIRNADSALQVKRAWQMPDVPVKAIEEFEKEYKKCHAEANSKYGSAYNRFFELAKQSSATDKDLGGSNVDREAWVSHLEQHFRFESAGGTAYLVLQAKRHWQQWHKTSASQRSGSVFDTPLFQPRQHSHANYQLFDKNHDLSNWMDSLGDRLPKVWFRNLSGLKTILPYPPAEIGRNINKDFQEKLTNSRKEKNQAWMNELGKLASEVASDEQQSHRAGLLLNLMAEHYFYKPAQRTVVLNIGRIFELVITSLLGDVGLSDLRRILHSAPFFSAKSQGQDITVSEQQDADHGDETTEEDTEDPLDLALGELQKEIAKWRNDHAIADLDISPWLIYKVFEKVYAMVSDNGDDGKGENSLEKALNKAGLVFYATWSAFGSFEKGPLFGLPELFTGVYLRRAKNFEYNDHFKINIGHLSPHKQHLLGESEIAIQRKFFARMNRTISGVLATHPLRRLIIDPVMDLLYKKNSERESHESNGGKDFFSSRALAAGRAKPARTISSNTDVGGELKIAPNDKNESAKNFLMKKFRLRQDAKKSFDQRLRKSAENKSTIERNKILTEMREQFGNDNHWVKQFADICLELDKDQTSKSTPVIPDQEPNSKQDEA